MTYYVQLIESLAILKINCCYTTAMFSPKTFWHLNIADLSKMWVIDNLDNKVVNYVCRWFELAIITTLSNLISSNSNYGLYPILPSTKFMQCPTIIWNALNPLLILI